MAHHLNVVLTEDLANLGKIGELVRVRTGYARNYLVPRGLAIGASAENVAASPYSKLRSWAWSTSAVAAT